MIEEIGWFLVIAGVATTFGAFIVLWVSWLYFTIRLRRLDRTIEELDELIEALDVPTPPISK